MATLRKEEEKTASSSSIPSRAEQREINDASHNKDNMLSDVQGRRDPTVFPGA